MQLYDDYWFKSDDGLNLYARLYLCPNVTAQSQPTIICIPGLTRNSADFAPLCEYLSDRFRVIAVDLRGRGKSDYDPEPENYRPDIYAQDMLELLDCLKLNKVVLIGTSLGGLVSMLLSTAEPARIDAVILNDIGPEAHKPGLERIKTYVSNRRSVNSWEEAVSHTREVLSKEHPNFTDAEWQAFTANLYRQTGDGRPELNYDFAITKTMTQVEVGLPIANLWVVFAGMNAVPLLLVRGELSDILTLECVALMQGLRPDMQYTEVPMCGHAPLLTETACLRSIDRFLASSSVSTNDTKEGKP